MREFTKSVFSFSWALSLFGIQQTLNLMTPSKAAKALNNVTEATKGEMGETLKATFRAGDNLQRELVDLALGFSTGQSLNPSRWMRMTSDVMKQTAEVVGQGVQAATAGAKQAASGWRTTPASGPGHAPDPRAAAGPGPSSSA
jgi:hypothetical protein